MCSRTARGRPGARARHHHRCHALPPCRAGVDAHGRLCVSGAMRTHAGALSSGRVSRDDPGGRVPTARNPGRRAGLTTERVVAAALPLELIDPEGLDSLSMRRLASSVRTMSLYNHVPSVAASSSTASSKRCSGRATHRPLEGTWDDGSGTAAGRSTAAALAHPNAFVLVLTRPVLSTAALDVIRAGLSPAIDAGLAPESAVQHDAGFHRLHDQRPSSARSSYGDDVRRRRRRPPRPPGRRSHPAPTHPRGGRSAPRRRRSRSRRLRDRAAHRRTGAQSGPATRTEQTGMRVSEPRFPALRHSDDRRHSDGGPAVHDQR